MLNFHNFAPDFSLTSEARFDLICANPEAVLSNPETSPICVFPRFDSATRRRSFFASRLPAVAFARHSSLVTRHFLRSFAQASVRSVARCARKNRVHYRQRISALSHPLIQHQSPTQLRNQNQRQSLNRTEKAIGKIPAALIGIQALTGPQSAAAHLPWPVMSHGLRPRWHRANRT